MSELANAFGYDYCAVDNEVWFNLGFYGSSLPLWNYIGVYENDYEDSHYEGSF